jgi:hypothetical protein
VAEKAQPPTSAIPGLDDEGGIISLRQARYRGRRSRLGSWLLAALLLAAGSTLAGVFYYRFKAAGVLDIKEVFQREKEVEPARPRFIQKSPRLNFQIAVPAGDWSPDESAQRILQANLAIHRAKPDVWCALVAKELSNTGTPIAELVEQGKARIGNYLNNLESEVKTGQILAGKPASRFVFQGDSNRILMSGECLVLADKGIAYWLFTWAPADSAVQAADQFAAVRAGFSLLTEQEDRQPAPPKVERFLGRIAPYSLSDARSIWKRWPAADEVDPAGDLYLQGRDQENPLEAARMASVLVVLLAAEPDPDKALAIARAHLDLGQKRAYPGTKMDSVPLADGTVFAADRVGATVGRVIKLRVKNGEHRERLVILAVVCLAKGILAIECDCAWERRETWEPAFKDLLATFTVAGPAPDAKPDS